LNAIETYLKKEKFSCRSVFLYEGILAAMNTNAVAFILQEGSPISHVVLLRRKNEKDFQIIDTSKRSVKVMSLSEAAKQGSLALFVAQNANDLPPEETFWSNHGLPMALFFAGLLLFGFVLKMQKSKEGTQKINGGETRP
jgi:hypothetical protein